MSVVCLQGGFAKAYEVSRIAPIETEEQRTQTWALKVIAKAGLTKQRSIQKLKSEIQIHRVLSHQNVVLFKRYFEDSLNVYMVLDLCQN